MTMPLSAVQPSLWGPSVNGSMTSCLPPNTTFANYSVSKIAQASQCMSECLTQPTSCILEAKGNQGALFRITDKLLQNSSNVTLPKADSNSDLANNFASFFDDKIKKIQMTMTSLPDMQLHDEAFPEPTASSTFSNFKPLTEDEVADLIRISLVKSSALEPIPADLFLKCLPKLLPPLSAIINSSLTTGSVSLDLKKAYPSHQ